MSLQPTPELQGLIQAYLDDALSAEQTGRLQHLLRVDDRNLDAFIQRADLHGFLVGLRAERFPQAGKADVASRAAEGAAGPAQRWRTSPSSQRPRSRALRRTALVSLAASMVAAILLFSAALSGKPRELGWLPKKTTPAPREVFRGDEVVVTPPVLPPKERIVVSTPQPAVPPGPEYRTPEPLVVPAPRPPDATAAKHEPPPIAVPAPAPRRTEAEAAIPRGPKVVSVADRAYFGDQTRVRVGQTLDYGRDLYTKGRGKVVLKYDDGTTVDMAPEAMVRELSDECGRRLLVSVGAVEADIRPQPEGRPMIFATSHAEAAILGTKIRLTSSADAKLGSTLEVLEGRVRFSRLSDGSAAEVSAGRTATASASQDLKARVAFLDLIIIQFGPADIPRPPPYYVDSGEPYRASIGFGWDPSKDGQLVPGGVQPDGSAVRTGRLAVRKQGPLPPDVPRATAVVAGWGEHAETWEIDLPNGVYVVSACVGDPTFDQGPHYVTVQGKPLLNGQLTQTTGASKWFFLSKETLVEVKDGKLKMKVGGGPGKSPADGSRETTLNYLVIKRVPAK